MGVHRPPQRTEAKAVVSLLLGVHLGEVLRTGTTRRGWDDGVVDLVAHALGPASDSD
jgi:hypothetical protein